MPGWGTLGGHNYFGGKVGLVNGSKALAKRDKLGGPMGWEGNMYMVKQKHFKVVGVGVSTTRCTIHRRLLLPPSFSSC
jgi:hypothetical protein